MLFIEYIEIIVFIFILKNPTIFFDTSLGPEIVYFEDNMLNRNRPYFQFVKLFFNLIIC